jgi:hypothetical protein
MFELIIYFVIFCVAMVVIPLAADIDVCPGTVFLAATWPVTVALGVMSGFFYAFYALVKWLRGGKEDPQPVCLWTHTN